jgi:hypothetical protein
LKFYEIYLYNNSNLFLIEIIIIYFIYIYFLKINEMRNYFKINNKHQI